VAKVVRSTIVDASIDQVWEILRDFNGHDRWHPAVSASRIEDRRGSDEIGCVRDFALAAGGAIRERLLALSDRDRSFTYCILDAPLPLDGYVATVRLKPVTDGDRTFWHWESQFRPPPQREAELIRMVGEDIYEAGFRAIKDLIARQRAAAHAPARVGALVPAAAPGPAQTLDCGAVVLARHGGPEVLEWRRISVPPPGPGEVRIRHTAIGVNYIDVYCRTGYFSLVPPGSVPGLEGVGIVTDVGPGVRDWAPGDRVGYACLPPGAYAEARTMRADLLVRLPAEIDGATAAAVLLKGMTAEFLLHRVARVKEGDYVLVHAAAGATGQLLCQWARALGATVIGTVGSPEKAAIARGAGCAHVVVYTDEDFVAHCRELTGGRGVDVAFDAVGRETLMRSYDALATGGHLVSFGQASGETAPVDIAAFAAKSAMVSRPNFAHFTDTPQKVRSITDNLFQALRKGVLRPGPAATFPLARAADAHQALNDRRRARAIVLLP
jgi:NADPH:quinone reductase-like Zn-dependent oxidoreductase